MHVQVIGETKRERERERERERGGRERESEGEKQEKREKESLDNIVTNYTSRSLTPRLLEETKENETGV